MPHTTIGRTLVTERDDLLLRLMLSDATFLITVVIMLLSIDIMFASLLMFIFM